MNRCWLYIQDDQKNVYKNKRYIKTGKITNLV